MAGYVYAERSLKLQVFSSHSLTLTMVHTIQTLCWLYLSIRPVVGHMEMAWPYALHSKFNPKNNYTVIDYSNTSPLFSDGSNFPCKGYQNDRPFEAVAELVAGGDHNLTLAGSARHGGGSCQISLSYDNGATFKVIKSIIGGCPLVSSYEYTVPATTPPGNALLAWTWQNLEGNREFYMNCAQINIVAAAARRPRRQVSAPFESLPLIWKANLEGLNDCATVEGKDVVYPNPGPSVSYGHGLSESSPATSGVCDAAEPFGATYEDLEDVTPPTSTAAAPATESITPEITTPKSSVSSVSDPTDLSTTFIASTHVMSFITIATLVPAASSAMSPTKLATQDHSSISTHVPRSLAMDDYQQIKLALMTTPTTFASTVTVTADCESTITVTVSRPSQSMVASTTRGAPQAPTSRPPYATGDPNGPSGYLPCVPGTLLCTSRTTWQTCNYNDGSVESSMTWVWGYERIVAAGMECLPFLSPYTDQTDLQQSNSPRGSYRDDRYIRARPDGDCALNGSIQCTYGGYQFDVCDQGKPIFLDCYFQIRANFVTGGWVQMGSVASGTVCRDGKIVAE